MEAARAARESGMVTVFGAPNILRGKSQSGAMRALDAVQAGLADCLCADYHPATLLAAVFQLPALAGISLPEAVRLVSANPARAAGLADRGEIAVGKRADLVSVALPHGLPRAARVYSAGRLAYACGPVHA
jgi:alpha-D-ribose 1-methylphosphonate 5-triphosphate diphosphatase